MDSEFDFLRPATREEYRWAFEHVRGGVYSTFTDIDGEVGRPTMMTTWCDKSGGFPSCRMEERITGWWLGSLHGAREESRTEFLFWVNPDLMPKGI